MRRSVMDFFDTVLVGLRGDLSPGCDVSTYLWGILGALLYVLRWRSEKASQWDSTPFSVVRFQECPCG